MKYTPGPWHAVIYSGAFDQPLIRNDSGTIGRLHSQEDRRHEANAKLIAKAPEMFELLKEFVHRVEIGEVRSKKTYAKFKEIIKAIEE